MAFDPISIAAKRELVDGVGGKLFNEIHLP